MAEETNAGSDQVPDSSSAEARETPADDSQSEQNAAAQPRRIAPWVWGVVALVVVASGVAAYFGYQQATARREAQEQLDSATVLVEQADAIVLEIDEVVRAEITTEVAGQASELQPQVEPARENLSEAMVLIDEAVVDLPEDDVARAEALKESAEARVEMLEQADVILDANIRASAALTPAMEAWQLVLDAEALADQAVAEYNKLTKEAVTKSSELTKQGQAKLNEAKGKFQQAQEAFAEADFSAYIAYVDGKLALFTIAAQADQAFLADKPAEANKLSDQYNAKDKQLVEQAKGLPATPADVVADAYEAVAGEATEAYAEARGRATQADSDLSELQ